MSSKVSLLSVLALLEGVIFQFASAQGGITDTLRTVKIEAMKKERLRSEGVVSVNMQDVRSRSEMSTPDILRTLQKEPGVVSGTEMTAGMYVRGGDGTDNLYLLDGAPLLNVSHILGLFSVFNNDIVDNVNFYKGFFPGQFGGKTSSVVEIKTKDGNLYEHHGSFSVGLFEGKICLEGPVRKGKTSYLVAARQSWMSLWANPVINSINKENEIYLFQDNYLFRGKFTFTDLNFKITRMMKGNSKLNASLFLGNDVLVNNQTDRFNTIRDSCIYVTRNNKERLWGNALISINWDKPLTSRLTLDVDTWGVLSYSLLDDFKEVEKQNVISGKTTFPTRLKELNSGKVINWGGNVGVVFSGIKGNVFSAGIQPGLYYYPVFRSENSGEKGGYENIYSAVQFDFYANDNIRLGEKQSVEVGFRLSSWTVPGKTWMAAEPRIVWRTKLSPGSNVSISYSKMSQPNHLLSTSYIDLPTNIWLPATKNVKPSISNIFSTGLYHSFKEGYCLSLGLWYKKMSRLYEYYGNISMIPPLDKWESDFSQGEGKAYGVESFTSIPLTERVRLTATYSLSWSKRYFDDFFPEWYYDLYDNRHNLNVQLSGPIGENAEYYLCWIWHSGYRRTEAEHFIDETPVCSHPNAVILPAYHRLDAGVNVHLSSGEKISRTLNLSVYNIYNRKNPYAYSKTDERNRLKGLCLFPIIPSFSYTCCF